MTSPSKSKGNSFERQVAQFLTKLYGETFIRAPSSGAYVGGSNQRRKQYLHEGQIRSFKGDIVPGQSFSKMNAECKSYKDFLFHHLFQGSNKTLELWINQCMDAADAGDFNIIFMKFNRKGTFVAVHLTDTTSKSLTLQNHICYQSEKYGPWAFMDFNNFFNLNSNSVKQLCN